MRVEDMILLGGAVIGAVGSVLTNDPKYAALGLTLGAVGKALGSYNEKRSPSQPPQATQ